MLNDKVITNRNVRRGVLIALFVSIFASCNSAEKVKGRMDQEKTIGVIYDYGPMTFRTGGTNPIEKGKVDAIEGYEAVASAAMEELKKGFPEKSFKMIKVPLKKETVTVLGISIDTATPDYSVISVIDTPLVFRIVVSGLGEEEAVSTRSADGRDPGYYHSIIVHSSLKISESINMRDYIDFYSLGESSVGAKTPEGRSIFPAPGLGLGVGTVRGEKLKEMFMARMDAADLAKLNSRLIESTREGVKRFVDTIRAVEKKK